VPFSINLLSKDGKNPPVFYHGSTYFSGICHDILVYISKVVTFIYKEGTMLYGSVRMKRTRGELALGTICFTLTHGATPYQYVSSAEQGAGSRVLDESSKDYLAALSLVKDLDSYKLDEELAASKERYIQVMRVKGKL
jgi:hypothetical protein